MIDFHLERIGQKNSSQEKQYIGTKLNRTQ
jgi:hypothetical protein